MRTRPHSSAGLKVLPTVFVRSTLGLVKRNRKSKVVKRVKLEQEVSSHSGQSPEGLHGTASISDSMIQDGDNHITDITVEKICIKSKGDTYSLRKDSGKNQELARSSLPGHEITKLPGPGENL